MFLGHFNTAPTLRRVFFKLIFFDHDSLIPAAQQIVDTVVDTDFFEETSTFCNSRIIGNSGSKLSAVNSAASVRITVEDIFPGALRCDVATFAAIQDLAFDTPPPGKTQQPRQTSRRAHASCGSSEVIEVPSKYESKESCAHLLHQLKSLVPR